MNGPSKYPLSVELGLSEALLREEQLQAKIERLEKALLAILNGEWDEECETKEGLKEAYTYVPRSLIDQALKANKKSGK